MLRPLIEHDIVLPVKTCSNVTAIVLEALASLYSPRRLVIVAPADTNRALQNQAAGELFLDAVRSRLLLVDEETFFVDRYGLDRPRLEAAFEAARAKLPGPHREFGWWLQQLLKLGARAGIPCLSELYFVWDADLVPLRPWDLLAEGGGPCFAILQSSARSDFNRTQYDSCLEALLGVFPARPGGGGTFVSHHFGFVQAYVDEMTDELERRAGGETPWPLVVLASASRFYRFSEYLFYASFVAARHPESLRYHPLEAFGRGLRFRLGDEAGLRGLVRQLTLPCNLDGVRYPDLQTTALAAPERLDYLQLECANDVAWSLLPPPPRSEHDARSQEPAMDRGPD